MACTSPLKAVIIMHYQKGSPPRKEVIISPSASQLLIGTPLQLPCGNCFSCRLERSRQWAIRCAHEASLHKSNSFVTLTYSPDYLPDGENLSKEHITLFMKRLRKQISTHYPSNGPIRFFLCGEYAPNRTRRPHYHILLFGFDFPDKQLLQCRSNSKRQLFTSPFLSKIWTYGYHTIGTVTFESASYVARYTLKKNKDAPSLSIDSNGNKKRFRTDGRVPVFQRCSNRPGIGHDYFLCYFKEWYRHDKIVIRDGITCRPPRYYDKLYERYYESYNLYLTDLDDLDNIKLNRINCAIARCNSPNYDSLSQALVGELVADSFRDNLLNLS